ncbi:MAG: thioredoxin family protein [Bacteroidota bacterium]
MKTYLFSLLLITLWGLPTGNLQPDWHTTQSTALEHAQTSGKPILLVFSGSDWCRPCMEMDRSVFQTDAFQAFAQSNLVLLKADFPRRRKNQQAPEAAAEAQTLAQTYNPKGLFPTLVLLDADGQQLLQTGFHATWESLQQTLEAHLP